MQQLAPDAPALVGGLHVEPLEDGGFEVRRMLDCEEPEQSSLVLRHPDLVVLADRFRDQLNVLVRDEREVLHLIPRSHVQARERQELLGAGRSDLHPS